MGVLTGATPGRSVGTWLFALALGAYLATAGGSLTTTDAVVAFDVTRNLVEHGTVATSGNLLGLEAFRGRDGRYYSPFGIGQSIYNIPFYVAGLAVVRAGGVVAGKPDTLPKAAVALGQTFLVAALVWQIFVLSRNLTGEPRVAAMAATTAAFGSVLWPYARMGFNQPLAAVTLFAAVMFAIDGARSGRRSRLALAGWCLSASLLTRHEMALAAWPIGAWLLLAAPGRKEGMQRLVAFAPGFVVGVSAWLLLNAVRFGNPLETGYLRDTTPGFGSSVLGGLAGLLFSPAASLLVYSPVAAFGAAGFLRLWRTDRAAASLLASISLVFLVFYATLGNWMAGRSWGSRYLVVILPLLMTGWAAFLAGLSRRARLVMFVAVTLAGVAIQLPGVLIDYSKTSQAAPAYSTADRQWRWEASPLVLNARALRTAIPANVKYVAGLATPPAILPPSGDDDRSFSQQFAFSLDFWWLYLYYMGLAPRWAIVVIVVSATAWIAYCATRTMAALKNEP